MDFAVLGYAITSMETETYRPARLILLGEDANPRLRQRDRRAGGEVGRQYSVRA